MTPQDCILMMALQLAETTNERDQARLRVVELEKQLADAQAAASNGSGDVKELART